METSSRKQVALSLLLRGALVGFSWVFVILAMWAFNADKNAFNWRSFAFENGWQWGTHDALPIGALLLYFLLGFCDAPIGWLELRASRWRRTWWRPIVATSLTVTIGTVLLFVIVMQTMYIGHVFDGDPSLQRAFNHLGSDFEQAWGMSGAVAIRAVPTVGTLVVASQFRLTGLSRWACAVLGAVMVAALTCFAFVVLSPPNANADVPGLARYIFLGPCLALIEPYLAVLAERLAARLTREEETPEPR